MIEIESTLAAILGVLVALTAIIGTQFLGWDWGDGQLIPTAIGVGAAGIAALFMYRRLRSTG